MPTRRRNAATSLTAVRREDTPSRRASRAKAEASPEPDVPEDGDEDAEGEVDEDMDAGPSRPRAPTRNSRNAKRAGAPRQVKLETGEDTGTDGEPEDEGRHSRRPRKSVSYTEVQPNMHEDEDDEDGHDDEDDGDAARRSHPPTPRRRGRRSSPVDDDDDEPSARPVLEKIGSGRGGFSVKGAAAAAARARWAKVRAEKIARGEDPDEPVRRRTTGGGGGGFRGRASKVTDESYVQGSTLTIKGREYTVGDDELIIPDDPKGETKVDADGKLLGGREYKLTTFTSEGRRNTNRVYAMTIDAARACGYNDSLAFLRRVPTIIKMACTQEERQLLMDIGRITGNLKYRQITMVSMRNVFKLMGARVVKGGKWVTDDYYEDESVTKCAEAGYTAGAEVTEDEIMGEVSQYHGGPGRPPAGVVRDLGPQNAAFNLTPFYALGGPTTHFAGSGSDPWTEAKWGHKRQKLRSMGVTEQDWLYRTAEETRRVDEQLREFREERLLPLEGTDAARGWVYALEQRTDGRDEKAGDTRDSAEPEGAEGVDEGQGLLRPPAVDRRRSGLSQEVKLDSADQGMEGVASEALTPIPEVATAEETATVGPVRPYTAPGKEIVVQTLEQERRMRQAHQWGLGMEWRAGVVRAAYEPHTHMPHVPLRTQPVAATLSRVAPYPLLSSAFDIAHGDAAQPTFKGEATRGLSSMEYVLQPPADSSIFPTEVWFDSVPGETERKRRAQEVQEAVEWEKEMRKKRRQTQEVL